MLDVKGPAGPRAFAARLFVYRDTHLPVMIDAGQAPPPARGAAGRSTGGAPPSRAAFERLSQRRPGPPPRAPETRLYFADYREVDGLKLPFRLRRALGPDTVEETTFDRFKINAKIDPKKFEVRK